MKTIVPANPGFYVLDFYYDEEGHDHEVIRFPVLAWIIQIHTEYETDYNTSEPVTYGIQEYLNPVILYPDGRIQRGEQYWKNETSWINWRINYEDQEIKNQKEKEKC